MYVLIFIEQFYTAIFPAGGGANDAKGIEERCFAFPVVLAFWAAGYA